MKFNDDFFWNICDFWAKESTQDDARGPHKGRWRGHPPGHAVGPCGQPLSRLELSFGLKKANLWIKIPSKFQPDRSYGSPAIKETVFGLRKQKRKIEDRREIQSRGELPLSLEGQGRRRRRGPLPPLLRWRRDAAGDISVITITNNFSSVLMVMCE